MDYALLYENRYDLLRKAKVRMCIFSSDGQLKEAHNGKSAVSLGCYDAGEEMFRSMLQLVDDDVAGQPTGFSADGRCPRSMM